MRAHRRYTMPGRAARGGSGHTGGHHREAAVSGGSQLGGTTPTRAALSALFESGLLAVIAGQDERVTDANDAFLTLLGATREELEAGQLAWTDLTPPQYASDDARAVRDLVERGWTVPYEKEYLRRDGTRVPVTISAATLTTEPFTWVALVVDRSERRAAEARLEARARQAAALAELGRAALVEEDLDVVLELACAVLGEQLGADRANVLELQPSGELLLLRAAWRWPQELVGTATVPSGRRSLAGYVLETRAPVVVDDLAREARFDPPRLMTSVGIASSLTVLVDSGDEPYGVLSAHADRPRSFTADDVTFAQGVANVAAAAVRRARSGEALLERETSLHRVLVGTRTAAWWWDVRSDAIRWSDNLPALHGLSEDERPGSYPELVRLIHPDDRTRLDAAVRAALEEGTGYELDFRALWPDGSVHWLHTEAYAEVDASGRTYRVMGVVRDVTEQWRRAEQSRLLAEATELFSRSLDADHAMRELAGACVPGIADWCAVHLRSPDGSIAPVAVVHRDPERVRWAREVSERHPLDPASSRGIARVLRTGEAELIAEIDPDMLQAAARDEDHHAALQAAGFRSAMTVPLASPSGVLGALTLVSAESGRTFDEDDLAFARELAGRAATAIDNARLHQAEREARRHAEDAARRTARLQELAAQLATATTREDAAEAFVREASRALDADAAFLAVMEAGELRLLAAAGYAGDFLERVSAISLRQPGNIGEAARRGEAVWLRSNDEVAERYPALAAARREAGLEAVALLPLVVHDRVIGIGGVAFAAARDFDAGDRELLLTIARQSAQGVERARLLTEAQGAHATAETRRAALERLLALTPTLTGDSVASTAEAVCRSAVELFGADSATLKTVEEGVVREVAQVPPGETPATFAIRDAPVALRTVVDERRATFSAEGSAPATLRLPLLREATVTAFMTLTWHERRPAPDEAELALATRFADQAAIALERAERLEAQQRSEALAAALERLLDPPPGIEERATVRATAREICSVARETLGCDAVGLWERSDAGFRMLAREPEHGTLAEDDELRLDALPGGGQAMLSRRPWFEADMATAFPTHRSLVEASGMRSLLVVPLVRGRETVVDLTLSWREPVPEPGPEMLALAQRLADRAYAALERARRTEAMHEAQRLHARLETSLMPVVSAATEENEVLLRYQPGEQRLLIGGDFADALALADGRIATIVGDVSGHGPDAAALGATLRAGWRALVLQGVPLEGLPAGLERLLAAERPSPETFVTLCCCELAADGRRIDVSSAGHPAPLVIGPDGVREVPLEGYAAPLGIGARGGGGRAQAVLHPDACLLLYSDGLVEGRAAPESSARLGGEGLRAFLEPLAAIAPLAPGHVMDATLRHATTQNGAELADDVAMLLLSPRMRPRVSIRLPAVAARLGAVREIVDRAARHAGLGPTRIDDAKLAVTEACANVVAHAYDSSTPPAERLMVLETDSSEHGLMVAVSDTGAGIGRRTGTAGAGLGLPLVRTLASDVDVQSGPDGTRVELRFRRDAG